MDLRTARDVAGVRARASVGGAALSAVLGVGCGVFAATAPDEARPVLVAACVLGLVSAVGCVLVAVANRSLVADPAARAPRSLAVTVVVGVLLAWLATVVGIAIGTGELAWVVTALGLVVAVLPAVTLALVTVKGPHPAPGA
ncbi:hypothetical protein [Oryzobacter terrae]|uniref:hypothetical protein n=1 Tax=Oryzobacter terrae TaxID=1620385 RepID=UPI0036704EC6